MHKNKMVKQSTKHPNGILAIPIQVGKYNVHCPLFTMVLLLHCVTTLLDALSLGIRWAVLWDNIVGYQNSAQYCNWILCTLSFPDAWIGCRCWGWKSHCVWGPEMPSVQTGCRGQIYGKLEAQCPAVYSQWCMVYSSLCHTVLCWCKSSEHVRSVLFV